MRITIKTESKNDASSELSSIVETATIELDGKTYIGKYEYSEESAYKSPELSYDSCDEFNDDAHGPSCKSNVAIKNALQKIKETGNYPEIGWGDCPLESQDNEICFQFWGLETMKFEIHTLDTGDAESSKYGTSIWVAAFIDNDKGKGIGAYVTVDGEFIDNDHTDWCIENDFAAMGIEHDSDEWNKIYDAWEKAAIKAGLEALEKTTVYMLSLMYTDKNGTELLGDLEDFKGQYGSMEEAKKAAAAIPTEDNERVEIQELMATEV